MKKIIAVMSYADRYAKTMKTLLDLLPLELTATIKPGSDKVEDPYHIMRNSLSNAYLVGATDEQLNEWEEATSKLSSLWTKHENSLSELAIMFIFLGAIYDDDVFEIVLKNAEQHFKDSFESFDRMLNYNLNTILSYDEWKKQTEAK